MGTTARVRAPELRGRGWLNTGGRELTLADLRGKIVLLDFWTFCCINCLHVLDELRPLEERYADVLVDRRRALAEVRARADPVALAAAVERYGVAPSGARRPRPGTWDQYAAKAWPTLVGGRPRGLRRGHHGRRGPRRGAGPAGRRAGRHPRGQGHPAPGRRPVRRRRRRRRPTLRFPGKAVVAARRHLLVADSARTTAGRAAAGRRDGACAASARAAGRADGPADAGRVLRAERAVPAARRRGRARSATTSSSPTR